jgi:hypothetical protein
MFPVANRRKQCYILDMITVRKYFPGFALPWDASEFEETKCATPQDVLNCHCWRDRVGNKKLQYPDNEEISTNVIFFDQGWGSIVALSDTVEEMKALIELAGIEPGHWWSDKEE